MTTWPTIVAPIACLMRDLVYLTVLVIATPWLLIQSIRTGKYREGWKQKLLGCAPAGDHRRKCAWFHAVSVGEVRLLEKVIDEFRNRYPDWEIVVSTTTSTGIRIARRQFPTDNVFFCPLDFSWAVRRAVKRVRPSLVVLAELEVWPNLIGAIKRSGAEIVLINGRISDNSFRGYRRLGRLLHGTFAAFDCVVAQTEQYADRFRRLGCRVDRVAVSGSLKFDGASLDRNNADTAALGRLAGIHAGDIVLLAGSTQSGEEAMALATFERLASNCPRLRLIIVPRHPERFNEVARIVDRSSYASCRRSQVRSGWRVLLVDTVGELGGWWGHARIAFVGGSMGNRGGQNMIEPAAYGSAVCFGPRYENFRDVVRMMLDADAVRVVADERELESFVRRCIEEPDFANDLGQRAQRLVVLQQGAILRTLDRIAEQVTSLEDTRSTDANGDGDTRDQAA